MSTIDGNKLKQLRVEINGALEEVAKRHNVSLRAGSASYDPGLGTATYKLEVIALGDGGVKRDMQAELFVQHAEMLGLKPEHLHKKVMVAGREFELAGYKPKARKNCMVIREKATGKQFVTDLPTIKRQLAAH